MEFQSSIARSSQSSWTRRGRTMHCQRRILNRHVHLPNCFSDWLKPEIRKQKNCLALSALAGVSALVDLKQSVQAESRERRGWIGDPACQATSSSVARKACEAAGYGGEGNALNQRDPETASHSTPLDRCGPDARARPATGILLRCYLISCRSVFRDFPSSMLGERRRNRLFALPLTFTNHQS